MALLAHHPAVVEELVLVLRALEAGTCGVCTLRTSTWEGQTKELQSARSHPPTFQSNPPRI